MFDSNMQITEYLLHISNKIYLVSHSWKNLKTTLKSCMNTEMQCPYVPLKWALGKKSDSADTWNCSPAFPIVLFLINPHCSQEAQKLQPESLKIQVVINDREILVTLGYSWSHRVPRGTQVGTSHWEWCRFCQGYAELGTEQTKVPQWGKYPVAQSLKERFNLSILPPQALQAQLRICIQKAIFLLSSKRWAPRLYHSRYISTAGLWEIPTPGN